ncbi:MAG: sigma-70 family RNA polymerase sigma factor [Planctomycetota bacterium]
MDNADIAVLLQRWADGDVQALARVLEHDRHWIRGCARQYVQTSNRAEDESVDVVQNATVRLLRYQLQYPPANLRQFRALVSDVVRQCAQDLARKRDAGRRIPNHRVEIRHSGIRELEDDLARITPPDVRAEREEVRTHMALALEIMDPDDRTVIELRDFRGLTFREVGERLGVSEGAATMRHQRATERLKRSYGGIVGGTAGEPLPQRDPAEED